MINSYFLDVIKLRYKIVQQPSRKTEQKGYEKIQIKVTVRSVKHILGRQNSLKFSNNSNKYQQNKRTCLLYKVAYKYILGPELLLLALVYNLLEAYITVFLRSLFLTQN